MRECRLADQKDRLQAITNDVVELGDGLFVVEIAGVAQATQQVLGTNLVTKMRREALKAGNFHLGLIPENGFEPRQALFQRKEVRLLAVDTNGNDDFIEKGYCSADQLGVAGGDGIERPGEDGGFHDRKLGNLLLIRRQA